jgi:exosortase/archaeosortase family protein
VLTDTSLRSNPAADFILRAVVCSLGIFGVLRLSWTEAHIILPATVWQGGLAVQLFGAATLPVAVTLACSGADAIALLLGAVMAYPVRWRSRLAAAAGGIALILIINTLRIGTLGLAASSPRWFNTLHVYVWPAILTLAVAGYVFTWMRAAEIAPSTLRTNGTPQPSRRFIWLTLAFLVVFAAGGPLVLESSAVLAVAGFIARAAAVILGMAAVTAHAAGNELWTPAGGFLVTQECITTPLIPVYLAAVCAYSRRMRPLIFGVIAALPLFVGLGIVRLLLVALPAAADSPLFFVHAFYQLLLGAVVVGVAAFWRHGRRRAPGYAVAGVLAGIACVYLLGPLYTRLVIATGGPLNDPQGAIAFLPVFQAGLYLALSIAAFSALDWKPLALGFVVLAMTQATTVFVLHAIAESGVSAHVRDIRGWAVAGPVLIAAVVANVARARR